MSSLNLKPPEEPSPSDCCGSGCARCVWDIYYDKLADYEEKLKNLKSGLPTTLPPSTYISEDKESEEDDGYNSLAIQVTSSSLAFKDRPLPTSKATGSIILRFCDDEISKEDLGALRGLCRPIASSHETPPNFVAINYVLPNSNKIKTSATKAHSHVTGDGLSEVDVLKMALTQSQDDLRVLQSEISVSRKLKKQLGGWSPLLGCSFGKSLGDQPSSKTEEKFLSETFEQDMASPEMLTHTHPEGPLIPLRVDLMKRSIGTSNTNRPGDVLEVLVPNPIADCDALCERLKLRPDRKVALVPSPFANPNSYPTWLLPRSIEKRLEAASSDGTDSLSMKDKKKALDNAVDGLILAQQSEEESLLETLEKARDKAAKSKQAVEVNATTGADSLNQISDIVDELGSVSSRTIRSIFRYYVDINSSAYLRPPFFAMLCRVAEATQSPVPSKTASVGQAGVASDAELLRFLSVGLPPSQLNKLLAKLKPTMLDVLRAFPAVTPQLPRLLEVCAPLRPRSFSLASSSAVEDNVSNNTNASVDIFIRSHGMESMLPSSSSGGAEPDDAFSGSPIPDISTVAATFRSEVTKLFRNESDVTAHSRKDFIGHASGHLLRSALLNSSGIKEEQVSDLAWGRIVHFAEEGSPSTNVANGANQIGLFPEAADKPLILLSGGSGYAPLRAVLQERLKAYSSTDSGAIHNNSSASRSSRTIVICSVKTLEEAAIIDGLIQTDIDLSIGADEQKRMQQSKRPRSGSEDSSPPTAELDMEDVDSKTVNPEPNLSVVRHFFISSLTPPAISSDVLSPFESPPTSPATSFLSPNTAISRYFGPPTFAKTTFSRQNTYLHSGRLVDWGFSAIKAPNHNKSKAMAFFPSTIISGLLYTALTGNKLQSTGPTFDGTLRRGGYGLLPSCTPASCVKCPNREKCEIRAKTLSQAVSPIASPTTSESLYSVSLESGASIFACGPSAFLATLSAGIRQLVQHGPNHVTSAEQLPNSSLDDSEAEYEVRKLFLNKKVVFDYWQD